MSVTVKDVRITYDTPKVQRILAERDARIAAREGRGKNSVEGEKTAADEKSEHGPSTTVELSDRARAIIERAKLEQQVVERLAQAMDQSKRGTQRGRSLGEQSKPSLNRQDGSGADIALPDAAAKTVPEIANPLKDSSPASQLRNASDWDNNYAPYGDPTISDADWLALAENCFMDMADGYDRRGLPPEVGNALRDAVRNGTIKVQRASEVEGLNLQVDASFTPSSVGGGYSSFVSMSQHSTGAVKDAIEQGRAFALWSQDRGSVYVSW